MAQINLNGSQLGNCLATMLTFQDIEPGDQGPHYVYALFRPDGRVCYIGKGRGNRWLHHEKMQNHYNRHLASIIRLAGGVLPKQKLIEGLSNRKATDLEVQLIAAIGREPDGPLVNLTDGGDGKIGYATPAETAAKIGKANTGKVRSAETRALMSAARSGKPKSRAHVEAQAAAQRGKRISEEQKQKMREAMATHYADPSVRAKIAEWHARMSPEEKEARKATISAATRAAMDTEARAKISAALTGRVHDENRRALTSETVRKAYIEKPSYRENLKGARVGKTPFLGKRHSAETRAKMSASQQARAARLANG